jgi:hypothetical protein
MDDDNYYILSRQMNVEGTILDERYFIVSLGITLKRNNFLYQITNEVINWLNSAGISRQLWEISKFIKPVSKIYPEPAVLTIDDLSFGFTIWWISCGVSCLAFMVELFYFIFRKLVTECAKMLIGIVLLLMLLSGRLKNFQRY